MIELLNARSSKLGVKEVLKIQVVVSELRILFLKFLILILKVLVLSPEFLNVIIGLSEYVVLDLQNLLLMIEFFFAFVEKSLLLSKFLQLIKLFIVFHHELSPLLLKIIDALLKLPKQLLCIIDFWVLFLVL